MPIDYKQYPANWKTEIRPAVMRRAGEVRDEKGAITIEAYCEQCKVVNHATGYRDEAGNFISWDEIENQLDWHGYDYFDHELKHCIKKDMTAKKPLQIVLTVAHLDNDKSNNGVSIDRLRAWCQRCHLNYDRDHHRENFRRNFNKKKGLQNLFTDQK